jgi:hypothetical protein
MLTGEKFVKNLLDALLPNRAAPALGRVIKLHEGPGKTKYSCDVRIVTAGSYEDTGQVIAEAPLSPVWVAKTKKGIYAVPPEGTLVIVEFLEWNPAYPYIAGVWSDEYDAAKFLKGQFVITDGKDLRIEFSDDEILIHDSHKFESRFTKGKWKTTNDKGLNVEIDSDGQVITADNGKQCSVVIGGSAVTIKGKSSTIVLDASGITANGAVINLN